MIFMLEHKGTVRPLRGETQKQLHDRFLGPDILCFTEIKNGRVVMLERVDHADSDMLGSTLSLSLSEAKELYRLLGKFIDKAGK